jgi:predicted  nucleic acid-binding Zn-ribbon protein
MTPMRSAESEFPVEIEQAECAPAGDDTLLIRLVGSRVNSRDRIEGRALLVLEADGQRHRFPEIAPKRRERPKDPTAWGATFVIPAGLEPALAGHASVVIGTATTPFPELPRNQAPARAATAPAAPSPPSVGLEQTVAALRAELRERGATEAQLRAALASAQAERDAGAAAQLRLEATHVKLREELGRLRAAVDQETSALKQQFDRATAETTELRNELQQLRAVAQQHAAEQERLRRREQELSAALAPLQAELATASVAREAAVAEAAGLRAELDRAAAGLVHAQRESSDRGGQLGEAETLLAEARALTQRLQRRATGSSAAV